MRWGLRRAKPQTTLFLWWSWDWHRWAPFACLLHHGGAQCRKKVPFIDSQTIVRYKAAKNAWIFQANTDCWWANTTLNNCRNPVTLQNSVNSLFRCGEVVSRAFFFYCTPNKTSKSCKIGMKKCPESNEVVWLIEDFWNFGRGICRVDQNQPSIVVYGKLFYLLRLEQRMSLLISSQIYWGFAIRSLKHICCRQNLPTKYVKIPNPTEIGRAGSTLYRVVLVKTSVMASPMYTDKVQINPKSTPWLNARMRRTP